MFIAQESANAPNQDLIYCFVDCLDLSGENINNID